MATWKKVVVSGSNVSQLNNDAGYITSGTETKGFATASFNGTNLLADTTSGSLNFASSSGQGLTISANAGTDTLTFGLAAIPNTSLANSSVLIGGQTITLGAAATTTLTGMTSITSTSFTGSLLGTASYAANSNLLDGLDSTAFVLNSQTSSMAVANAVSASYALTSSYAANADLLDGLNSTAFVLNSQTSSMAVASAVSASYASSVNNLTNAITNNVDNRVITATGTGTINGEANLTFDGTNLILTGNQVISGDLTVNGTTTTINTQNLNVADRFILLSSGSATPNDGGIIVQSATGGTGFALLYDSAQARWAFTGSLSGTATTAAPDAFVATVIDLNVAQSTDIAAYQKPGNIKIATNEDIFIWS